MATHSSTLAWRIPWREEPGRLQSMGSPGARQDFTFTLTFYDYGSILYDYINPFNICCKSSLVVLYFLNFCLSEMLFISPSILNEILVGYGNLGCRFSPFSALNISCHSLWPAEFLLKDQLLSIWGFPCTLPVSFPLLLLIFFLCV